MESAILTPKRTEYGKAIRKQYESGAVKESRHNMTELEPRTDGISNTITTVQKDNLLLEVNKLGNIYGFDCGNYAGNVYDSENIAPTIRSHSGGNTEPMVIETNRSKVKTKPLGNLNGYKSGSGYNGSVYDENGLSPTINTMGGGNREPMIVAMRGRNPDNPSDRTAGSPTEQRLEPNSQGICNTLTSVQKDNMVLEKTFAIDEQNLCIRKETIGTLTTDGSSPKHNNRIAEFSECNYRIRKLTPLECWRLMDFSDEDFRKAESTNSNSQLYRQAGNSIVKNVLVAIFGQMIPGKEKVYMESEE